MPAPILSPDCHDGKHRACLGDAWSHLEGGPVDCECGCHEDGDDS